MLQVPLVEVLRQAEARDNRNIPWNQRGKLLCIGDNTRSTSWPKCRRMQSGADPWSAADAHVRLLPVFVNAEVTRRSVLRKTLLTTRSSLEYI